MARKGSLSQPTRAAGWQGGIPAAAVPAAEEEEPEGRREGGRQPAASPTPRTPGRAGRLPGQAASPPAKRSPAAPGGSSCQPGTDVDATAGRGGGERKGRKRHGCLTPPACRRSRGCGRDAVAVPGSELAPLWDRDGERRREGGGAGRLLPPLPCCGSGPRWTLSG